MNFEKNNAEFVLYSNEASIIHKLSVGWIECLRGKTLQTRDFSKIGF